MNRRKNTWLSLCVVMVGCIGFNALTWANNTITLPTDAQTQDEWQARLNWLDRWVYSPELHLYVVREPVRAAQTLPLLIQGGHYELVDALLAYARTLSAYKSYSIELAWFEAVNQALWHEVPFPMHTLLDTALEAEIDPQRIIYVLHSVLNENQQLLFWQQALANDDLSRHPFLITLLAYDNIQKNAAQEVAYYYEQLKILSPNFYTLPFISEWVNQEWKSRFIDINTIADSTETTLLPTAIQTEFNQALEQIFSQEGIVDNQTLWQSLVLMEEEWGQSFNLLSDEQRDVFVRRLFDLSLKMRDWSYIEDLFSHPKYAMYVKDYQVYLLQMYMESKQFDKARQTLRELASDNNEADYLEMSEAYLLAYQGDAVTALSQLQKILDKHKGVDDSAYTLGDKLVMEADILSVAGNYQQAYEKYSQLAKNAEGYMQEIYRNNQADLLFRMGDVAASIKMYEQILASSRERGEDYYENDASFLNNYAYTLAHDKNRLSEAAKLLEKANTLQPNQGHILDSLGWVNYRLGRTEAAVQQLGKAYGYDKNPEIAAHYIQALAETGQKEQAELIWREAYQKDPTYHDLAAMRERFGLK